MKNIRYDGYLGPRLSREVQMQRIQKVIREELTELQRYTLCAYYFQQQTTTQIARDRNVNKKHRLPDTPPGGGKTTKVFEVLTGSVNKIFTESSIFPLAFFPGLGYYVLALKDAEC